MPSGTIQQTILPQVAIEGSESILALTARSPRANPIRILIVGEQAVIMAGVAALLANDPDLEVGGWAPTVEAALGICASDTRCVVLMDLELPEQACGEMSAIKRLDPATRVVALAGRPDELRTTAAIQAGVQGCILKTDPLRN